MIAMSRIPTEADLDFNGDELFDKKIIAKSELLLLVHQESNRRNPMTTF